MARPIRTYSGKSYFNDSIGIGVIPEQRLLTVAGDISATGSVSAPAISGTWAGDILQTNQVNVEGVDIKSTGQPKDLFLRTSGDGKATWDAIDEITFDNNNVSGDLIVRGDIIEYASGDIVFTKTSVFTGPMTTGANTLQTFDKTKFKTAKYVVTLSNSTPTSTAFEILTTHDGLSAADGTVYGIVTAPCDGTSLLSDVTASVGSTSIDLIITVAANCTATVYGVAHY
jgi:hypothetical protein